MRLLCVWMKERQRESEWDDFAYQIERERGLTISRYCTYAKERERERERERVLAYMTVIDVL